MLFYIEKRTIFTDRYELVESTVKLVKNAIGYLSFAHNEIYLSDPRKTEKSKLKTLGEKTYLE